MAERVPAMIAAPPSLALRRLTRVDPGRRNGVPVLRAVAIRCGKFAAVERIGERKIPMNEAPRRAGDPPILVAEFE